MTVELTTAEQTLLYELIQMAGSDFHDGTHSEQLLEIASKLETTGDYCITDDCDYC